MQVLIDIPVVCHPDMMCPGKIQISILLVLAVDDLFYKIIIQLFPATM